MKTKREALGKQKKKNVGLPYFYHALSKSKQASALLHHEKRTPRAGNGEGDLLFFFEKIKRVSYVPFAQADVGTAVQVPLASLGDNFYPQCFHQKTVVQMTKSVLGNFKYLGRWQCCLPYLL
jgi:hypothetical protein